MTTINIPGFASSTKTPGFYFAVVLGGSPTSSANIAKKILVAGSKITTTITDGGGASPVFSVTAGTRANESSVKCYSADDASTYFGAGSELHGMVRAAFEQYPNADVTAIAVAETSGAGAARASGVLTFVGTASGAVTLRLHIADKVIDVGINSGGLVAAIALAVATAILREPDLPVTAQSAAGAVTVTAKNFGTRGNDVVIRAEWIDSSGRTTEITTAAISSGVTTTAQFSGVTTADSTYFLSLGAAGAVVESTTLALAAIANTKYDRQVWAMRDTTAINAVVAQIDTQAGVAPSATMATQVRQQAVFCTPQTNANAITLATGGNDARAQIVWHYNSPLPPPWVAAQVTAARLFGDALAGGVIVGEASDPASNLINVGLKSVLQQHHAAERPTAGEIEDALNNGLTPLAPSGSDPGKALMVRSITSRSLYLGVQNYSVIDTAYVTVPDYVADDLQAHFTVVYAGTKLGTDTSDGSAPKIARVVTPNMVRDEVIRKLKDYEANGILINVDAHINEVQAVASATPGRVDIEIPAAVIPPFAIGAGVVRQFTQ